MQSFRVINFDSTVHCYNVLRVHKLKPQHRAFGGGGKNKENLQIYCVMRWHFFCLIFHSVIHTDCEKVWLIFIPFFSLTDVLSSEIGGVNKHGKLGVSSAKCYICKCVGTLRGKQTNGKRTLSLIPQWTEITLKGDNRDIPFFKLFKKHRLQILEKYSVNSR